MNHTAPCCGTIGGNYFFSWGKIPRLELNSSAVPPVSIYPSFYKKFWAVWVGPGLHIFKFDVTLHWLGVVMKACTNALWLYSSMCLNFPDQSQVYQLPSCEFL